MFQLQQDAALAALVIQIVIPRETQIAPGYGFGEGLERGAGGCSCP